MLIPDSCTILSKVFEKTFRRITDQHVKEDSKDTEIGTTKTGNGPAYRDKHARSGLLAKETEALSKWCVDVYDILHCKNDNVEVLCEGAQGFGLDIDLSLIHISEPTTPY